MSRLTTTGPKCETCERSKRFTNGDWECRHCSPCAKSIEDMARKERKKQANKINSRAQKDLTKGYRNRASDCQAQKHRIHQAPKVSKTLWMPVWAADLKEPDPHDRENYQAYEAGMAIVAAVREARAAQRRLGVGR